MGRGKVGQKDGRTYKLLYRVIVWQADNMMVNHADGTVRQQDRHMVRKTNGQHRQLVGQADGNTDKIQGKIDR